MPAMFPYTSDVYIHVWEDFVVGWVQRESSKYSSKEQYVFFGKVLRKKMMLKKFRGVYYSAIKGVSEDIGVFIAQQFSSHSKKLFRFSLLSRNTRSTVKNYVVKDTLTIQEDELEAFYNREEKYNGRLKREDYHYNLIIKAERRIPDLNGIDDQNLHAEFKFWEMDVYPYKGAVKLIGNHSYKNGGVNYISDQVLWIWIQRDTSVALYYNMKDLLSSPQKEIELGNTRIDQNNNSIILFTFVFNNGNAAITANMANTVISDYNQEINWVPPNFADIHTAIPLTTKL